MSSPLEGKKIYGDREQELRSLKRGTQAFEGRLSRCLFPVVGFELVLLRHG